MRRPRALVGDDRESHQRDLFEAIERGDFPKWRVMVQVMPETEAEKTTYNPFDLTKVWPHERLSADRGRRPGAEPQSRELLRRGRAGGLLAGQRRARHRPQPGQDAAVPASSPTPTRTAIGSASTTRACRSTGRAARSHTYHRDGAMRFDDNGGGSRQLRAQQLSAVRRNAAYRSRRCASPATPIATITATATTTTRRPATCSG